MFSVGSEAEAKSLLIAACPTNDAGDFVARELVEEQTLENLELFGLRLAEIHDAHFMGTDHCACA